MTTYTYTSFLSLTNDVLTELNEVNLTSGNFGSAVGFASVAQNAINKAIRDINAEQYEWPFNHIYTTQVLTPGVPVYSLPNVCKTVDWNTFFLQRDAGLTNPSRAMFLPYLDYDEYCQRYRADDQQMDSSMYAPPLNIFRTQNMEFGVTPYPDQAYTIGYEYWAANTDMVNYDDLSQVPNLFDWIVINGAMYYCYKFRENLEAAADSKSKFQDGVKYMRNIYGFNYTAVRDLRAGPQFAMRG